MYVSTPGDRERNPLISMPLLFSNPKKNHTLSTIQNETIFAVMELEFECVCVQSVRDECDYMSVCVN